MMTVAGYPLTEDADVTTEHLRDFPGIPTDKCHTNEDHAASDHKNISTKRQVINSRVPKRTEIEDHAW